MYNSAYLHTCYRTEKIKLQKEIFSSLSGTFRITEQKGLPGLHIGFLESVMTTWICVQYRLLGTIMSIWLYCSALTVVCLSSSLLVPQNNYLFTILYNVTVCSTSTVDCSHYQRDQRWVAHADCWNWGKWGLQENIWKRSFLGFVLWARCAGTIDFCPAMAALVMPSKKYYFSHRPLFHFISLYRPATWAGSCAGSPVSESLVNYRVWTYSDSWTEFTWVTPRQHTVGYTKLCSPCKVPCPALLPVLNG